MQSGDFLSFQGRVPTYERAFGNDQRYLGDGSDLFELGPCDSFTHENHPFVDGVETATIGGAGDGASRSQSDGGWASIIAIIAALLFYIWIGSAIIEKLAPVAGGQ
jgi:hypothetical protein